jgi:hypothetical protein
MVKGLAPPVFPVTCFLHPISARERDARSQGGFVYEEVSIVIRAHQLLEGLHGFCPDLGFVCSCMILPVAMG